MKKMMLFLSLVLGIGTLVAKNYDYLTFTATMKGETHFTWNRVHTSDEAIINGSGSNQTKHLAERNVEYSVDGGNKWNSLTFGTEVTLHKGDKISLRGSNTEFSSSTAYTNIYINKDVEVSGDIMSLLDSTCQSTTFLTSVVRCFEGLFKGCPGIVKFPPMSATKLASGVYNCMFKNCKYLEEIPFLPAKKAEKLCYINMFFGCTKLREAYLPAEELEEKCYEGMFYDCTNLNRVEVEFTSWKATSSNFATTENWLKNVASEGVFICPKELKDSISTYQNKFSGIPAGWKIVHPDYLTFSTTTTGTIALHRSTEEIDAKIEYRTIHEKTWHPCVWDEVINLSAGDTIYLKGRNTTLAIDDENYISFVMTGEVRADGNIMSLLDGAGFEEVLPVRNCFMKLFAGCGALKKAPQLPATTITPQCYKEMFVGTGIDSISLPAATLADSCYMEMFEGCSQLKYINISFDDWAGAKDATLRWVKSAMENAIGVNGSGEFVAPVEFTEQDRKAGKVNDFSYNPWGTVEDLDPADPEDPSGEHTSAEEISSDKTHDGIIVYKNGQILVQRQGHLYTLGGQRIE